VAATGKTAALAGLLLVLSSASVCGACRPDEAPGEGSGRASARGTPTAAAAPLHRVDWLDPEPPEAQERAAAAATGAWNADKRVRIADARTARVAMRIGTLSDRTGRLGGGTVALARVEGTLDQRLERLGAEVSATEVRIRLSGSVLFDFDSDVVRPDAERTLAEVLEVLRSHPGRAVRIEGHTDSIATDAYNLALSDRRATAVRGWLVAHGAQANTLATQGFGESRPVAANDTAAGRQRNRRVEIVIERRVG
jgi:OmpA-OmpF porin, OOP family